MNALMETSGRARPLKGMNDDAKNGTRNGATNPANQWLYCSSQIRQQNGTARVLILLLRFSSRAYPFRDGWDSRLQLPKNHVFRVILKPDVVGFAEPIP
jgi:hypothetical protein